MNDRPVLLVTGGSRGIGRAVALRLATTHHVLVGGRSAESVTPVVEEVRALEGGSAEGFVADLDDAQATARAVADLGRVDVLVHSAGVAWHSSVVEASREDWRAMFETNVVAVADLTRLLLPTLREHRGQVVTINSGAGYSSGSGYALYSGTKFALRAFTDALREEERGVVRVSSIHPGRVDTDMQVALQAQLGRDYVPDEHLRPESVAEAVALAVLASPEATVESVSIRPA
ncbi:SDR family oxidoreductase [Luteococcus peritonei]|uniref:SDR family oxidoreductase n=1 Tax=Luteococcus peritonei TaxID=88874 RepID=A0ABW4RWS6_9ACTN